MVPERADHGWCGQLVVGGRLPAGRLDLEVELGVLARYFTYYNGSRCHLSLDGDTPTSRTVQGPERGRVVAFPEVGGLHHRYERTAAR